MDNTDPTDFNLNPTANVLFRNPSEDGSIADEKHSRNLSILSSPTSFFAKLYNVSNMTDDTDPMMKHVGLDMDPIPTGSPISYLYGTLPLIFFCVVSVAINIKILMSVHWIRRPLSPTLHISLSLAGADAFSSTALAIGLVMNSFIPLGLGVELTGTTKQRGQDKIDWIDFCCMDRCTFFLCRIGLFFIGSRSRSRWCCYHYDGSSRCSCRKSLSWYPETTSLRVNNDAQDYHSTHSSSLDGTALIFLRIFQCRRTSRISITRLRNQYVRHKPFYKLIKTWHSNVLHSATKKK